MNKYQAASSNGFFLPVNFQQTSILLENDFFQFAIAFLYAKGT